MLLAAAPSTRPATENFRRGVNLSHWYAQSHDGDYDAEHLASYFTADDAAKIQRMGFDHVRLTFDDAAVFDGDAALFEDRVKMLLDAGLAVVVDLHPDPDYKQQVGENDAAADGLVADWRDLAGRLADLPRDRVWFEVMNEPHGIDPADWRDLQLRAVDAIREAAPEHTIVVSAGGWTNAATLYGDPEDENGEAPPAAFEPYGVPNLVYTFHFYDPHLWTHQGAGWGWEIAERTKGLPWPADPADAERIAAETTDDDEAAGHVRYHVEHGRLTEAWALDKLDRVAAWQREHDVPVYVGEFGVYTPHAPRDARLRWHGFVADAFEERGWGWAMWDYAGGFGVVDGDEREPDAGMLEALGLGE